jgi:hypothetical protein
VRDIIKAYYDKKTKKLPGPLTAENAHRAPGIDSAAAILAPAAAVTSKQAADSGHGSAARQR